MVAQQLKKFHVQYKYTGLLMQSKHFSVVRRQSFPCIPHNGVGWSEGTTPLINLNSRWSLVVSFTFELLYPGEKSPRYPLNMWLGGAQNQAGCFWRKTFLLIPGIEPWSHECPARSLRRTTYHEIIYVVTLGAFIYSTC